MSTEIGKTRRQNAWRAFAGSLGYTQPVALRPNVWMGLAASTAAATILLLAAGLDTEMAVFWTFGLLFGFVLQRSRFCFASAFRDMFLLRDGRSMKGVLTGLMVAVPAFAILMSKQVANPGLGILPPDANVLPLGVHTVLGGLLFGAGMVIAGGCVSGSIYRMGEGYVASWVSFGGILAGLFFAALTWNWWWAFSIADGARLWLPAYVGYGGALAVTLAGVGLVYLLILWWESRGGLTLPVMSFTPEEGDTFAVKLGNSLNRFFRHGWSILVGGAVLGGLNALLFYYAHPWGFTGEISRWVIGLSTAFGAGPGELEGAASLPGCALELGEGGLLSHMLFLVLGMVFGSFIAALFAGEFKIRLPRQKVRYAQASGGGLIMGYGAGIAMGCTIGAFFSAIPSLAVNGWVFAVALAAGAWIGTKVITRL